MIGLQLKNALNIKAEHALYRKNGDWYHQLRQFPGVLFDPYGYVIFARKSDYTQNKALKRRKDLHITDGIASLKGYTRFTIEEKEMILKIPSFEKSIKRSVVKKQRAKKPTKTEVKFVFQPSEPLSAKKTIRNGLNKKETLLVKQLHREICENLYFELVKIHGKLNIACDCHTGDGTYIDIVLKREKAFTFYEIKTYTNIRQCIREGFGQLMEYAFWNSNNTSNELVIVSNNFIDAKTIKYFTFLREQFTIPIFYQYFDLNTLKLSKKF